MQWYEAGNSPKISFLEKMAFWFSPGIQVRLHDLCIIRVGGRYGSRTDYDEIDGCVVEPDICDGKKIHVVELNVRDKNKFRINSPVEKFIVPQDVSIDRVLQILRNKGVNVGSI